MVRFDVTPTRFWLAGLMAIALVVACDSHPEVAKCGELPPTEEMEMESPLDMSLEPNRVVSGTTAVLSVHLGGGVQPGDSVGPAAYFACWNGAEWTTTHILMRSDLDDTTLPDTRLVEPGPTHIIASKFQLPSDVRVRIPLVPAGIYRIQDRALDSDIFGFVLVEVIEP